MRYSTPTPPAKVPSRSWVSKDNYPYPDTNQLAILLFSSPKKRRSKDVISQENRKIILESLDSTMSLKDLIVI